MSAPFITFDDDDFATAFPPPSSEPRESNPPPPPSDSDDGYGDEFSYGSGSKEISHSPMSPPTIATTGGSGSFAAPEALSPMNDFDEEEKHLARITNADELSGPKTFATSMTHNFEVVSKQVESGIYAAKRVSSFLKKITIMEEEYAKNLKKQLEHEQTKLARMNADGMKQYSKAWLSIQDAVTKKVKMMTTHASKVTSEVVTPLIEFRMAAEEKRKEILMEERKWTGEMARARDEVVKGLSNCQKLIQSAKATIDREKGAAAPQKNAASGLFQKFQQKLTKSSKSIQQDASKAAISYNAAIAAANKRQIKYLDTDLPHVFTCMQQLEKNRLDTIKAKVTRYVQLQQAYLADQKEVVDDLKRAVDLMQPDTDIQGFIENWVYEHGPPLPSHPYIYALPCTPKEIEAGQLEGNPNSVFRSTLQHAMELQKDTDPRLEVPKILVTLIKAIKDLKGYESEGIFRISVAKSELEALHKQIDEGNYDIRVNTPHAPAALLKEWLRLLAEPLIPEDLYEDAIASVKDREYSPQALQAVFQKLPKLNQKVVEHLAVMAKEISNEKNSEINKMSIDNLAIVFAPSFLRNPSDDPLKLLENSKYETKFTASLFRSLPG